MSNLLSGGTFSHNAERMKQIREETIKKWDGLGFLDGLKGHVKENITQLYECQACSLLNEVDGSKPMPIVKKVLDEIGDNPILPPILPSLPKNLHTYIKRDNEESEGTSINGTTI